MSIKILEFATSILHVNSEKTGRWIPPPAADSFVGRLDIQVLSIFDGDVPGPAYASQDLWLDATRGLVAAAPELFPARIRQDPARAACDCVDFFGGIRATGAAYLPFWSQEYPPLLREIVDPPLGLVVAGDATLLGRSSVAVVGSRYAAAWAMDWASTFGGIAARSNLPVISGGAYGCDAAVHSGMLAEQFDNVPAVVVFAGGLDVPYPKHNIRLFEDILASGGCLVTERGVTARCRPHDFLARNRIISGMAGAAVIVQAAERSGAMVTARCAADQGRDVLVVRPPGSDIRAAGNDLLIGDGALAVTSPDEALGHLVEVLTGS